jgi:hypothetical protein
MYLNVVITLFVLCEISHAQMSPLLCCRLRGRISHNTTRGSRVEEARVGPVPCISSVGQTLLRIEDYRRVIMMKQS